MGFISHFLAGGLFNRSEMNKKLDEISDLTERAWKLIDKIDNTKGYSGTWTAPDVFGDGSAYDLGAYMIGGGGSGAAIWHNQKSFATGGASGYGVNTMFSEVVPGRLFNWVIGKKGASVTTTTSTTYSHGNAGGSTSFGGVAALGGSGGNMSFTDNFGGASGANGGQGSDGVSQANLNDVASDRFGCRQTEPVNSSYSKHGLSDSPRNSQNAFDPTAITLCAGGWAAYTNKAVKQTINLMPDGTGGGSGNASGAAANATGYGNGGGGGVRYGTSHIAAKSGAGSDGVIFLYARKAVNTNA